MDTKDFKFKEFIKTSQPYDNTPDEECKKNIIDTMLVMQKIRDVFGDKIIINSGFRSVKVNKAVKGSANSAHIKGYACDFVPSDSSKMKELQDLCVSLVKSNEITVDQLIIEYPNSKGIASWLHIGLRRPSTNEVRGQILTIKK